TGAFRPRGGERRLKSHDGGAFEAHVTVSPLVRMFAVAKPVIGESEASGVRHFSIDNNDSYVGSIAGIVQRVPVELSKKAQLHSCRTQAVRPLLLQILRAERVEYE